MTPPTPEAVDVSVEAVDNAASYLLETGYPNTAVMLRELRQQLTAAERPLVMADGSSFADYLRNAVPDDTQMDDWTRGYEACKRRLARILLPQMEQK